MIFKRDTYQNGCLYKEQRKAEQVWCFRWRELGAQGKTIHRKRTLGSLKELPTRAAASKAAAALRLDVNRGASRTQTRMTVDDLVAHYLLKELPEEDAGGPVPKAHSTTVAYRRYLKKWILPRWSVTRIDSLSSIRIEEWLGSLPLANGSKVKIRNIMSAVFNHAIRHGFLPHEEAANPMKYVRQSASSATVPIVLSASQVGALLAELTEHVRVMVLLDAFTGLRRSELLALRWRDIDFERERIQVCRAIVEGKLGGTKTAESRKPVAMHSQLAAALRVYRDTAPYNRPDDWVFASARMSGTKPLTPGALLKGHIQPAARRAGIVGPVGFHTFRRTFASLLVANGEDVKVVQESMRHASSRMTLDTYALLNLQRKQAAQGRLINQITPVIAEARLSSRWCSRAPCTAFLSVPNT